MSAQIVGAHDDDLYDGFVSFHLMDLAAGVAIDVFAANRTIATVYARLPFPGANAPARTRGASSSPFDEFRGVTEPGQMHRYAIAYDRGEATPEWHVDGKGSARAGGARSGPVAARDRHDDREGHRARQGQCLVSRSGRGRDLGRHPRAHRGPLGLPSIGTFVRALRAPSLTAGAMPVLTVSALVASRGVTPSGRIFALTLLGMVSAQGAVNLVNDYFDDASGLDADPEYAKNRSRSAAE